MRSVASSKGSSEFDAFVDRIVQFTTEGKPKIPRSEIRAAVLRWPRLRLRIHAMAMTLAGRVEILEELEEDGVAADLRARLSEEMTIKARAFDLLRAAGDLSIGTPRRDAVRRLGETVFRNGGGVSHPPQPGTRLRSP